MTDYSEPRETIPDFDELPTIPELGLRHGWGVFGSDDELGTVNFLTPDRVAAAARSVRSGTVTNLVVPITAIRPPLYEREEIRHTIFSPDRNSMDDKLDNFYLQGSSQWDGLRHVRAREFGFWGGVTDPAEFTPQAGRLGIEHWVEHGMVGRGVLLDIERHFRLTGRPIDPFAERSISHDDLEAAARTQGTTLEAGDVLCVRFGWMGAYLREQALGNDTKAYVHEFVGLAADEAMSRWLWNQRVAAVACDNPSIEVSPGDPKVGSLHRRLLPLLGFALGELFSFDRLAERCADDGRWDFLFVSVPLHLPGGVGSPANAIAIQ